MSRETPRGTASVRLLCHAFGISPQAYYDAKKAPAAPAEEGDREGTPRQKPGRVPAVSDEAALAAIRQVIDQHAAWGHRKVWAVLRRDGLPVGRRRVYALMKAHGLGLAPDRPARQEPPARGQVVVPFPNRRWATDLTTVWTERDGTVAIALVVDCGCRSVLALQVSKSQEARVVLRPIEVALWNAFRTPERVPAGLELRCDHGPQYTGSEAEKVARKWGYEQTFAPVGRPTGNAVAERTIRTLKEECIWLRDWQSLEELEAALLAWQRDFNERRPHQALGWQTPSERRRALGAAALEEAA